MEEPASQGGMSRPDYLGDSSGQGGPPEARARFGEPRGVQQALVRSNLKLALAECDADLVVDHLPTVDADVQHLTQLFQNLVGNAIKFRGPSPPRIHVSARLRKTEDGTGPRSPRGPQSMEWLFSIRDNGIGIDPKFSDRIFVIFQRLNTRTEYPGNGMGLAICQKIVQRHGGRIWVESVPGEGATFHFTLPVRKDADQTVKEAPP